MLRGDASEQIPQVLASARSLLENLERLTADDSPLSATLGHVESVTGRMRGRHGALSGVLGSEDNARKLISALDRTNSLLAKTDTRVFGEGGMLSESQAAVVQLKGLLREARDSLRQVDAILADTEIITGNTRSASADLQALRSGVETSLRKAGQLIDGINNQWPFARDTEIRLP